MHVVRMCTHVHSLRTCTACACARCVHGTPCMHQVERRLSSPVQTLADFLASGGDVRAQLAKYGQARDGGLNDGSTERLQALAPAVDELAVLERAAQHSFLLGIRESLQQPTGGSPAPAVAARAVARAAVLSPRGGDGGGSDGGCDGGGGGGGKGGGVGGGGGGRRYGDGGGGEGGGGRGGAGRGGGGGRRKLGRR